MRGHLGAGAFEFRIRGRQWLDVATLFDPTHAAFGDWLIDFDAILDAVAAIPAPTT